MQEKETFRNRLKHAWNAFTTGQASSQVDRYTNYGPANYSRPDKTRLSMGNERSIVNSVYSRISTDVAAISIQHVRTDQNGRFIEPMTSGLNDCLTLDANMDQTGRSFIKDVVLSMFDEGQVAMVPTDTTFNPQLSNSYDIQKLRVGKILEWYPAHVKMQVYNEKTAKKEDITVPKSMVAIIENPFYSVMNEPNSTLQRLIRKLNLIDAVDEQSGSGKLDIIIQLPYVIKTAARKEQAEIRRKDIEEQLSGSKYGIAYTDGTERITQLNRPTENNLMGQITYLTSMLYGQLGITEAIFNGSAGEQEMLTYFSRTIEPIVSAIVDEMKRKFLTKTARSQNQSIVYFRDPFKLVPVSQLADIADKFTRNEILSSNEFRGIVGFKPSSDPKADELKNKNINAPAPVATDGTTDPPLLPSGTTT